MVKSKEETIQVCRAPKCSLPGTRHCAPCKATYCSPEHQKEDWKEHKIGCPLYVLKNSPEWGRYFVASRSIKAGTKILSELPALVQPIAAEKDPEGIESMLMNLMLKDGSANICLACCTNYKDIYQKCNNCSLPICSKECSVAPQHANYECKIFKGKNPKFEFDETTLKGIYYIRGTLLKKESPQCWSQIEDLQSTFIESSATPEQNASINQRICNNFKKIFKAVKARFEPILGAKFFDEDTCMKLYVVLRINGFAMQYTYEEKEDITNAHILYPKSSMFTHACFPNCVWGNTAGPVFWQDIRASVDIPKGQMLTISYSQEFFTGSMHLKDVALESGTFICRCDRCRDPSELGTMMSAIKCKEEGEKAGQNSCPNGYLLPINPSDLGSKAIWKCTENECTRTKTWAQVKEIVAKCEKLMDYPMFYRKQEVQLFVWGLTQDLHPNHWVIQKFWRTVMGKLADQLISLDQDSPDFDALLELYQVSVIASLDKTSVSLGGINYYRGLILHRYYVALMRKFERMNMDEKGIEVAKEIQETISKVLKIKRLEPSCRKNSGEFNPIMVDLLEKAIQFKAILDKEWGDSISSVNE